MPTFPANVGIVVDRNIGALVGAIMGECSRRGKLRRLSFVPEVAVPVRIDAVWAEVETVRPPANGSDADR